MAVQSLINGRDITIEFSTYTAVGDVITPVHYAAPIEAYVAILRKIEQIEDHYRKTADVADMSGVTVYVTGNNHIDKFEFELTSTMATGTYVALLQVPN